MRGFRAVLADICPWPDNIISHSQLAQGKISIDSIGAASACSLTDTIIMLHISVVVVGTGEYMLSVMRHELAMHAAFILLPQL
jgi:hypothetical protein